MGEGHASALGLIRSYRYRALIEPTGKADGLEAYPDRQELNLKQVSTDCPVADKTGLLFVTTGWLTAWSRQGRIRAERNSPVLICHAGASTLRDPSDAGESLRRGKLLG